VGLRIKKISVRDLQNYKTRYVTSTGSAWVLKIDKPYPSDVAEGLRGELVLFHVSQMQLQSFDLI